MIKSLSPYYFYTPWVSPTTGYTAISYTIKLYIWSGDKLTIPSEPQYTLTKENIGNSIGSDALNVSRLLNDFIEFEPQFTLGLNPTVNQRWVHKSISYYTGSASDGNPVLQKTELLLKGYGYGYEGENPQPPKNLIYLNSVNFRAGRQTVFSVPLEMALVGAVTVTSYPNNEIDYAIQTTGADLNQSSQVVQCLNVDLSTTTTDKYVLIKYDGGQIYVQIEDELKYAPQDVYFMNKEGEQQCLTFFKERRDTMTVTKETYESDVAQPNTGAHQYVDLNIQARTKFTLSSGFIDESLNEGFKELSLSTRVYLLKGDFNFIPINVKKKSLAYKTRVNEKLIEYVFEFEYSYNEINNI